MIFSDQHRGARGGDDQFRKAERAYNAALAWYFRRGYTLVVLGDADELWKNAPASVVDAYGYTLSLEAAFHREGRLLRVIGNHDDDWLLGDTAARHLQPLFGPTPLTFHPSLLFSVRDGGRELGRLFLVHGHQGSPMSDRWAHLSRLAVRYLYRPWLRLTGVSLDTPSKDPRLRYEHNLIMHAWAATQPGLVLVCGHTHRPVFESRSHPGQLQQRLAALEARLATHPGDRALQDEVAAAAADLEWVRSQENERHGAEGDDAGPTPCYFNAGCCCFGDGDITGLDIEGGTIRLVHWPDKEGRPRPLVLEEDSLQEVFARVS
ncbi:metallophosphoesterase [Truepera radiovictrix]|uniref:Metallophosphoesterase n=1 Tax=Truepera radiovictrix (strain DSM 17093 / CIP 108686 / LMG 22925 / RQ-24) TaxID=649638 RepID=D7CRU4_TRURR|nr:metallophosphoesterase [Truepera radiovictrix]ADI15272.1 metallophosphoesterase [Truepera radiovictrix DSM 17093]WMT56177.1 hypothetical protein RCV51_09165 [Truepera radiovictrix]